MPMSRSARVSRTTGLLPCRYWEWSGPPVSFEVVDDDFVQMEREALEIAPWGKNVVVKMPFTNSKGEFCGPLVERLSRDGVHLNATALMDRGAGQACLEKLPLVGRDLDRYSLETVEMFYKDATAAGYRIASPSVA